MNAIAYLPEIELESQITCTNQAQGRCKYCNGEISCKLLSDLAFWAQGHLTGQKICSNGIDLIAFQATEQKALCPVVFWLNRPRLWNKVTHDLG